MFDPDNYSRYQEEKHLEEIYNDFDEEVDGYYYDLEFCRSFIADVHIKNKLLYVLSYFLAVEPHEIDKDELKEYRIKSNMLQEKVGEDWEDVDAEYLAGCFKVYDPPEL